MTANELDTAIAAAQAGREEGYRKLFSEFSGVVFRLVSRMVADVSEAEELTQDVFLQAFATMQGFRPRGLGFEAWICRIAYNKAVDTLRHEIPRPVLMEDYALGGDDTELTAFADPPDIAESYEKRQDALVAAVAQLPEEEQALLQLFYYEEKTLSDISFITGLNTAAVANRLSRTRKKLRKLIENQ
ncbi:MAG: sigma-70 family RNA polymerase sigma factor [Alloprevotella sp.]|nr:sigma-70 family RNA polymerase sigma factor [Alloprevotella sp.]MBR1652367.1 sigma-70 family RNA polymerase sigma factor [Alloprevotella sp.]MBR1653185.1 sigma-70 family RNA polymerase sigma factor [Alloprevotella sp.]